MRNPLRVTGLAALLALAVLGSGCKNDSATPTGVATANPAPANPAPVPIQPNTVTMAGTSFSPATITIAVGSTVTWKNNDGIAHTTTSDTGVWDTGNMAAGSTKTTTFTTAGTFPYHCTYHASMGMRGTVVVK